MGVFWAYMKILLNDNLPKQGYKVLFFPLSRCNYVINEPFFMFWSDHKEKHRTQSNLCSSYVVQVLHKVACEIHPYSFLNFGWEKAWAGFWEISLSKNNYMVLRAKAQVTGIFLTRKSISRKHKHPRSSSHLMIYCFDFPK